MHPYGAMPEGGYLFLDGEALVNPFMRRIV
jgi:hypothetical protein